MAPRRLIPFLPLVLPLILGVVIAVSLQTNSDENPVYSIKFRIDLGTMILLAGLTLSAGLIFARLFGQWLRKQRDRLVNETQHEMTLSRRRFLRQLDHEFKNPLTALRMELAYLAAEKPIEADLKVFSDMNTQVDRLSRLVTDLRKLAQLEEQEIQRTPVALGEILQEVLDAAQDHPNFPERQVSLTLLQHPLPLSTILGDRSLLWLACFNLLDNALKFSQPGAKIEVRAFEIRPWLVLEIADDGAGIPEGDLPHIFEELYRGENARGVSGSGLGLALVRTIAALHAGSITVRSQLGQGTVFTLRLPVGETKNGIQ